MKIFGLNKIKDLKFLTEKEFKTESEKHKYLNRFRKSYKYIVCLNSKEVYEAEIIVADYYQWDSDEKEYLFCLEVPKSIKNIKWESVCSSLTS